MLGWISLFNRRLGRGLAWLNLAMVFVTFAIVVFRYCFGVGWVWLQETVIYCHATVFMLAVGYTLVEDQHVKVDIFYSRFPEKQQNWVNVLGCLFFLFPFCGMMIYFSWPYVVSSWKVFEGSGDANGLPGIFVLKTLLIAYPTLLIFQGIEICGQSIQKLRTNNG